MMRPLLVRRQWSLVGLDFQCLSCAARAPEHLRSCPLALALESTADRDSCPQCFGWPALHAEKCPKGTP